MSSSLQAANHLQKPITITKSGGSTGTNVVVTLNIPTEAGIKWDYSNLRFRTDSGAYFPFTRRDDGVVGGTIDVMVPLLPAGSTTFYMEYGDTNMNYIRPNQDVYYVYTQIHSTSGLLHNAGTMYQYARIEGAAPGGVGMVTLCRGAGTRGELVYDLPGLGPHYEMFGYVRAASGTTADAIWFGTSETSYAGNNSFDETTNRGGYSFEVNSYQQWLRIRRAGSIVANLWSDKMRDGRHYMLHARVVNNVASMWYDKSLVATYTMPNTASGRYFSIRARSGGVAGTFNLMYRLTIARIPDYPYSVSIGAAENMTPSAPSAQSASSISSSGFTARWNPATSAKEYYLDVSTSSSFGSFVSGYNNLNVGNATSRAVTGLNAGTVYYYRVRAKNVGTSGNSGTITVTTHAKPGIASPTISNVGQTSATLGATVASDGGTLVTARGTVWGTSASPAGNAVAEGGTGTGAFTHNRTGLPSGKLICFRGYAVNAVGTSYSQDQWFWTLPANPTAHAASSISDTGFTVNWSAATGATNYFLDVSTSSSFSSYVSGYQNLSVGNTTLRSISGLSNGTTYYYRLRAQNSGGTSGNSITITVTTHAKPGVASPSVSNVGQTSATLGALVASDGGTPVTARGTVWGTSASPTGNAVAQGGTGTGAFTHNRTGLPSGTLICFRGYAVNAVGTSYSQDQWFWTIPPNPAAHAASSVSGTGFTANWSTATGATNYYLDVSTSSSFSSYVSGYQNLRVGNITSRGITGLAHGTTYYYRLRAQNSGGTSGNSGVTAVRTYAAPTLTTPYYGGVGQTSAVIGATVSDNGGDLFYARGTVWGTAPNPTANAAIQGQHHTDTGRYSHYREGLPAGTRIYFRGYAVNDIGTSYSPDGSFWTIPPNPTALGGYEIKRNGFIAMWLGSTGATNYLLDVSTANSFGSYVPGYQGRGMGSDTTGTVTGLQENVVYYFRIRAQNSGGVSGYSGTIPIRTLDLLKVVNPTAIDIEQDGATIGAAVYDAEADEIIARGTAWGTSPNPTGNMLAVNGVGMGIFAHSRTNMPAGTLIYFRGYAVRAEDTVWSPDGSFWTIPPNPIVHAAREISADGFTIDWSAADGATNYYLDVSTSALFTSYVDGYANLSVGNRTSYSVTDLDAGMVYYYRVRAQNKGGTSGNAVGMVTLRPGDAVLDLSSRGDPAFVVQGDTFIYGCTVLNHGAGVASDVVVTCSLPDGILYRSNNVGHAYAPETGSWSIGKLEGGQQHELVIWADAVTPGVWTNSASIDGDWLDLATHHVVVILPGEVVITNLTASTSRDESIIRWDGVPGVGYSIYSSDEAYAPAMEPRWDERATMVASEEVRHFMDADTPSGQVTTRYYHVTYSGTQPAATNLWALIRKDIKGGAFTLLSPPVRLDRAFDGEMGRMLAEQLNGHDGGSAAGADEVFIFQPDGSWRNLYLDGKGNWCEANGEPSRYELAEGHGFFVARRSAGASRVTFAGRVGNDGTASVEIKPGFNLLGLSEGKALPLKQTFAAIQPVGAAVEDEADQLIIQQANGTWRRLMYIQGWGAPYDGNWFDLQTFSIVSDGELLPPGAAYYYLRRGPATTVSF